MKIGIIGAGTVGSSLGRALAAHRHEIRFGVRDVHKARELVEQCGPHASASDLAGAVHFASVVVLALPWAAVKEGLKAAGPLDGRILIDCTNPVGWDEGPVVLPVEGRSGAEAIARLVPDARIVKAFNTHGAEFLLNPRVGDMRADTYICGDDADARATVRGLAEQLGFDVIDAGPLRNAALLEHLAVLWIHLALRGGLGRDIAFKLLRHVPT
jgi:hypothetical protein